MSAAGEPRITLEELAAAAPPLVKLLAWAESVRAHCAILRVEPPKASTRELGDMLLLAWDEYHDREAARQTEPRLDLSAHEPYWVQSRDEPVGQWNCPCGHTFAPDDLDRYQKHLVEAQQRAAYEAAASEEGGA